MQKVTETVYQDTVQSKYNVTAYSYDGLGNITETATKDQGGTLIRDIKKSYDQAVSFNNGTAGKFNTTTTTSAVGATPDNNKDYKSVTYADALGRTAYTVNYTSPSESYTNTGTYSNYNDLAQVSGDTITKMDYKDNDSGQLVSTQSGVNENKNNEAINYLADYNGFNDQVQSTDPNGSATYTQYDALGNAVEIFTPFIYTSSDVHVFSTKKIYYDAGGRKIEEKQQNNKVGDPISYSDTKYSYDNMGNLIQVEQANGSQGSIYTQYYYNTDGKLLREYTGLEHPLTIKGIDNVQANGDNTYEVLKFDYNFYGKLTSKTDGDGSNETYQYNDLTGQLIKDMLPNSKSICYTYDNAGNTIQIQGTESGQPTVTETYTYDLMGNKTEAKNDSSDNVYVYDADGRCTQETDKYNSGDHYEKGYQYDGQHLTKYSLLKNGDYVGEEKYTYYNTGRINTVSYDDNKKYVNDPAGENNTTFTYDDNGNVIYLETYGVLNQTQHDSNATSQNIGSFQMFAYDLENHVIYSSSIGKGYIVFPGINQKGSNDIYYEYALNGNLVGKTSCTDNTAAANTGVNFINTDYTNYTYDSLNRLTNEIYGTYNGNSQVQNWQNSYTYDDDNNRTGFSHIDNTNSANNSVATSTYDYANRMTAQSVSGSSNKMYSYNYDNAGNLLTKQEQSAGGGVTDESFTYNSLNQTTGINKKGTATLFGYDANNQRITKTTGNTTTSSIWNGDKISFDFANSNGSVTTKQYLPANSGEILNGTLYCNVLDGQGDAICSVNDNDGSVRQQSQYDAYGNVTSGSNTYSPMNYRREYYDADTGLYYLGARYYDPTAGIFTQQDTNTGSTNDPATLNLYGYCGGNPVNASDPSGHSYLSDASNALAESVGAIGAQISALEAGQTAIDEMTSAKNASNTARNTMNQMYQEEYTASRGMSAAELHMDAAQSKAGYYSAYGDYTNAQAEYSGAVSGYNAAYSQWSTANSKFESAMARIYSERAQENRALALYKHDIDMSIAEDERTILEMEKDVEKTSLFLENINDSDEGESGDANSYVPSGGSAGQSTHSFRSSHKDTTISDELSLISNIESDSKTVIGCIGCFCKLEHPQSFALGAYGYIFSTPFAIASHMTDPYLTSDEQLGLSGMEVVLAGGGLVVAAASPPGWIGVIASVGYAAVTYVGSNYLTGVLEEQNGKK